MEKRQPQLRPFSAFSPVSTEKQSSVSDLVFNACHSNFDETMLRQKIEQYQSSKMSFHRIINDSSTQKLAFNVMPSRSVTETLEPSYYSVGDRCARATFSRSYQTEMEKSPTHLILISALIQWQKLIYLMMCEEFGVEYDPSEPETFKIWPTDVSCQIPILVRDEKGLRQDAIISKLEKENLTKWTVEAFSAVNGRIGFVARASVFRIR